MKNLRRPGQFPYQSKTAGSTTPATTRALRLALDMAGYDELRAEQARPRERREGNLMGIGVSFFTEAVGAGPRKHMDILGLGMADGAELRVHPTGKAVLRLSCQSQGQGPETTFAQILAAELGIPAENIDVVHGDTDQTPSGLGTYGSRSTPVSGAATAVVARRVRERAKLVASAMLEVSPDDLEWEKDRWFVRGDPEAGKSIQDIAMAAHSSLELPVAGHLDASCVYNAPNLTYPFGAHVCVADVDADTGEARVARCRGGGAVLSALGLSEKDKARVHTPTGLDIGAPTPAEIAISVFAELLAERPARPPRQQRQRQQRRRIGPAAPGSGRRCASSSTPMVRGRYGGGVAVLRCRGQCPSSRRARRLVRGTIGGGCEVGPGHDDSRRKGPHGCWLPAGPSGAGCLC